MNVADLQQQKFLALPKGLPHSRARKIYNSRNSQHFQRGTVQGCFYLIYNSRNSQHFQRSQRRCPYNGLSTTVEILSTSKGTPPFPKYRDLQQQKFLALPKGLTVSTELQIYNSRNSQHFQRRAGGSGFVWIYNSRNSQHFQRGSSRLSLTAIYNSRNSQHFQRT